MAIHTQHFHLVLVVFIQRGDFCLEIVRSGRDQITSQYISFFIQGDLMSAQAGNPCSFHTGHSATNDDDLFRYRCFRDAVVLLMAHLGIDSAGYLSLGEIAPDAALVAADAGADTLRLASDDLLRVVRVGDGLTANDRCVDNAIRNGLLRNLRVGHTAAAKNRNGDDLFNLLYQI